MAKERLNRRVDRHRYRFLIFPEVEAIVRYMPKNVKEEIHYFFTIFFYKQDYYKRITENEEPPFIHFTFDNLAVFFGRPHVVEAINYLQNNGLLTRTGDLTEYDYYFNRFLPITLTTGNQKCQAGYVTSRTFLNRLNKHYSTIYKNYCPEVKKMIKIYKQTQINLTHTQWMNYCMKCFFRSCTRNEKTFDSIKDKFNYYKNTYKPAHELFYESIRLFNETKGNQIYELINQDKFSGRVSTVITALPSFIRNTPGIITINKQNILSLDLKQSQPMIMALTLQEYHPNNDYTRKFKQVGDIYIYMARQYYKGDWERLSQKQKAKERNKAKKIVFRMMFGRPYGQWHEKFKSLFPQAARLIFRIKKTENKLNPNHEKYKNAKPYKCRKTGKWKKKKYQPHTNMAYEMQTREVTVFRLVWSKLLQYKIKFVSIHDEILVQASRHTDAYHIMKGILDRYFEGFTIEINNKPVLL